MRVGREEAVDVFRKWFSERTLLRCEFDFSRFAAAFRARVALVEPDEIRFFSDDTLSEMALLLKDDFVFEYAEPRGFPEEARVFDCCLAVWVPGKEDDLIIFTQIIEQPEVQE